MLGEVKDRPSSWRSASGSRTHPSMRRKLLGPLRPWHCLDPARPAGAPEPAFHDGRELRGLPPNQITFTAKQAAEIRHGYFANISYMDAQLGKVLDALDQSGLAGRTIILRPRAVADPPGNGL